MITEIDNDIVMIFGDDGDGDEMETIHAHKRT